MPLISTLARRVTEQLKPVLGRIIQLYSTYLHGRTRHSVRYAIPFTIAATLGWLVYVVYRKLFLPPASLRHLPHCSTLSCFKYYFTNDLVDRYSKNVCHPAMDKGTGVYAVHILLQRLRNILTKATNSVSVQKAGRWTLLILLLQKQC